MFSVHRLSLFTRLLAPFVLVVTIAFAVEAWLVIRVGKDALDNFVVENLTARARDRFETVDQFLVDRTREITSWCGLGVMDDILVEDRVLNIENFLLQQRRDLPQIYETLEVLNRSETVVASTDLGELGKSVPVAKMMPHAEPGGDTRWSALPVDSSANPVIVRIAQPIQSRLSTEPIGWLVASVRWDAIEEILVGPRRKAPENDSERFFLLVDAEGIVVAGNRAHTDAAGKPKIGDDCLRVIHRPPAAAVTPLRGLSIVAAWNKRQAFNVDRVFVAVVLGSTALGLLLAAGVSFAIARYITERLQKLVEGTGLVARGELSHRIEEGPEDEFGELARAFNTMEVELARTRDGLEGAVARWKALVTHAPDVILTVDREGTILFANRVVPGLTVDGVIGTNVDRYTPPEHALGLRGAIDRVFRSGEPESIELKGVGPNDTSAWYSSRIGPVRRDDAIVAVTIITTDITDRKQLESEVLDIAESERARIGRDLHDDLGQSLTGIALLSKGLEQRLAAEAPEHANQARQIGVLIGDTIGQTRALAQGLFPSALERAGLRGALDELAVGVERMHGVRCEIEMDDGAAPADRSQATHLYRIVQEAMNNALRHGNARHVDIVLGRDGNGRFLAVRDDGSGLPSEPTQREGMGLRSMRYRASVLGGTLELRANPDGGAMVVCRFS